MNQVYQPVSSNRLVDVEDLSRVKVLLLKDEEGGVGDGVGADEHPDLDGGHLTESRSSHCENWNSFCTHSL